MTRDARAALLRLTGAALVVGVAAVGVRLSLKDQLHPREALLVLQRYQSRGWALPSFAASYVLLTTALAPAVLFHLVAGAAWGFGPGLAVNLAVFNATASLHFWIARRLGRERVRALLGALGLGKWDARLGEAGLGSALALRVLPLPTLVASASAGISAMRWRDFALGTLLGALPWIGIYTWFSAALVAGAEGAERRSFIQALAAAIVILAATALARRRRARSQTLLAGPQTSPYYPAPSKEGLMAAPAGEKISIQSGRLQVPGHPVIPFIEGDGTGADIWRASQRVFDAAVEKAYAGKKKIAWKEVLAGEKAFQKVNNWLPDETVEAFRTYLVGIKGPLTTPIGGGIRSLNVALRQMLDLYVCLRPVRYFRGVPSPVKAPEKVDMVIFRENTEDIYAGIEYAAGSPEAAKILEFFSKEFPKEFKKVRFGTSEASGAWQQQLEGIGAPKRAVGVQVGVGLKQVSYLGTERLVHSAIEFAIGQKRKSVTLVHKGNIMKFTEGAFRDWGYKVAKDFFGAMEIDGGPWCKIPEGKPGAGLVIKDAIADITLQQVLTRPEEFDVIATLNLNGDYLSDALAAQVGGIGIAPGGNINYVTGHAVFEATHGTAPKYANQDKVNPGSVILSGEMMFRHLGWNEAALLILKGMDGAISKKTVTYDFARLMKQEGQSGVTEVKCSEFGQAIIQNM